MASELKSRDFLFLTRDAIANRAEVIETAERLIDRVPALSSSIRAVVREAFLLGAREEYDVSHSEPRWPNWIFVSAPRTAGIVSGLRFGENVVHEAMHLQLTDLEARVPLVADIDSRLHSPWKQEARKLQGILHGLYVFACISAFFDALLRTQSLPEAGVEYIHRRTSSIRDEVASVASDRLAEGLTESGRQFLEAIEGYASSIG